MEKTENGVAVQSNKLVNGRFSWTLTEAKIFLFLLAKVKKGDRSFRDEKIPIELFKTKSGNIIYKELKDAANRITKRNIGITETNNKDFTYLSIITKCAYKSAEGCLVAKFNDDLKPYILDLKGNFTFTEIQELLGLNSFYSHRIYWLLKQYETFGTRTIKVEDLRRILELENMYERYRDFRKRVLDKAKSELEDTDMAFDFEEIRRGLKVIEIKFNFKSSKKKLKKLHSLEDLDDKEKRLVGRLLELELDEWQIQVVLDRVGAEGDTGIWKLINDIKMDLRDGKVKGKVGGYTAKLLDDKYKLGFFNKH